MELERIRNFISDPGFVRWAHKSDPGDYAYWEAYRVKHPGDAQLMEEARLMILGLQVDRQGSATEIQKAAAWRRLDLTIRQLDDKNRKTLRKKAVRIASTAATVLLIPAFLWVWNSRPAPLITYQTAFGEVTRVTLPDRSVVWLNAHSEIRYPKAWGKTSAREVQLEGEAFFDVQHLESDVPFVVRTGDIGITVLGTQFNVLARDEDPVVSLAEGKVQVNTRDLEIVLEPGESVRYDRDSGEFDRFTDDVSIRTSWTQNIWIFHNTRLGEVFQRIETEYGLPVIVEDPGILERQLSGRVSTKERVTLLKALGELLFLDFKVAPDKLIVTNR